MSEIKIEHYRLPPHLVQKLLDLTIEIENDIHSKCSLPDFLLRMFVGRVILQYGQSIMEQAEMMYKAQNGEEDDDETPSLH